MNREMNWNLLYEKQQICAQSAEVAQKREEESVLQHPQLPQLSHLTAHLPELSLSSRLRMIKVRRGKDGQSCSASISLVKNVLK